MSDDVKSAIGTAICTIILSLCLIALCELFLPKTITTITYTNRDIQEIYDDLFKYTGIGNGYKPQLVIIDDDSIINAYQDSQNNVIAIYTGLIKFADSKDEIAGVLAHEIGHLVLQHSLLNPMGNPNIQTLLEGNADKFGAYLMLRAGYNVCKMHDIWWKLRNRDGDYLLNSDHPNYSYRYWQLEFPMCGDH